MGEEDLVPQDSSGGFDANDAMRKFQDIIGSTPDEASQKLIGQTLTPDEKREVGPETLAALSYFKDVLTGGSNEEIVQKAGTALDEISRRKIELAKKLSEGDSLTRPQAVAAGFISMLPMLIGAAVKGKRGLSIGANAGAVGSQVLFKGIEADNAKADTRDRLQYQELGNQQKDIVKFAADQVKSNQNFENSKALIDHKALVDPQKGTTINIPKETQKLTELQLEEYTKANLGAVELQKTLNFMDKNFKDNENLDWKGIKQYGLRKLAEQNPNSKEAELMARIDSGALKLRKSLITGNSNESENKKLDGVIEGKGVITTIGQLRTNLNNLLKSSVSSMNIYMSNAAKTAELGGRPMPEFTAAELQKQARASEDFGSSRKTMPFYSPTTRKTENYYVDDNGKPIERAP